MYSPWIVLVAATLLSWRLTWLAIGDTLTRRLRERGGERWCEFVSCPWCIGWWISLTTFAGAYLWQTDTPRLLEITVWLAFASGANLAFASIVYTYRRGAAWLGETRDYLLTMLPAALGLEPDNTSDGDKSGGES